MSVEITLCFAPCVPESGTTEGPPPIRLVGSNVTNEGRVELLLQGQWGTVCDDYWSTTDAQVINRCFVQQDLRKKPLRHLVAPLLHSIQVAITLGPWVLHVNHISVDGEKFVVKNNDFAVKASCKN